MGSLDLHQERTKMYPALAVRDENQNATELYSLGSERSEGTAATAAICTTSSLDVKAQAPAPLPPPTHLIPHTWPPHLTHVGVKAFLKDIPWGPKGTETGA